MNVRADRRQSRFSDNRSWRGPESIKASLSNLLLRQKLCTIMATAIRSIYPCSREQTKLFDSSVLRPAFESSEANFEIEGRCSEEAGGTSAQ